MDADTLQPAAHKRRRRWLQFSLRTLLLMAVVVGVAMSCLVAKKKAAMRQRECVEAIRKDNGLVLFDYEVDSNGAKIASAEPPGPAWVRKLLGVDFVANVVAVRVDGRSEDPFSSPFDVTKDTIDQLATFSELRSLDLDNTTINDAGLNRLAHLRHLRLVSVRGTRVTAAGVEEFRNALPGCTVEY